MYVYDEVLDVKYSMVYILYITLTRFFLIVFLT